MSIILDLLGLTILFIILSKFMLSVLTGVPSGGCKYTSSLIMFLVGTHSCAFKYNPPRSYSSADSITDFIILA